MAHMKRPNRPTRFIFGAGAALATCVLLWAPSIAMASVGTSLRVVDSDGNTLAQQTQYTDTVTFATDPNATCFGPGTGGSGNDVTVSGPTALGAVVDGSAFNRALRPVSVTDAFSFGLGICGFGDAVASGDGFWYLKYNHSAAQVGGDQVSLLAGDQVLWWLDPDFRDPPPNELVLNGPARARPGTKFKVKVIAFADNGTRIPAVGADVTHAAAPTDASGRTTVRIPNEGHRVFQATRAGDIPSNELTICFAIDLSECSAQPGELIFGTARIDQVTDSKGSDRIRTGGKADRVTLTGGDDRVNCGAGNDSVSGADNDDRIARNCEKVGKRR